MHIRQVEYGSILANSSKFYRVGVVGTSIICIWGRRGAKGQSKITLCRDNARALQKAETILNAKIRERYVLTATAEVEDLVDSDFAGGKLTEAALLSLNANFQEAVANARAKDLAELQSSQSELPEKVVVLEQWKESGRAWKWVEDLEKTLAAFPAHYDKQNDCLFVGVGSASAKWFSENWIKVPVYLPYQEGDDQEVLETMASLWEQGRTMNAEDALDTARALR